MDATSLASGTSTHSTSHGISELKILQLSKFYTSQNVYHTSLQLVKSWIALLESIQCHGNFILWQELRPG